VKVILLGPQRRPTVDAAVRALSLSGPGLSGPGLSGPGLSGPGLSGPVATVTAGWREREPDDAELTAHVGGRAVNLMLYRRWLDVQDRDPEYLAGARALADVLAELQEVYLLRLDYALRAVYALQRRPASGDAVQDAVAAARELDTGHLRRVNGARREFFDRLRPHDRPVIAAHRAEVAAVLAEASALVVAGGHVGVLADVLHLFNLAAAARSPVIAWSAGAMALTDRIVLFHDRAPQGPGHPEVYGTGLSLLRDAVLLPHARARLLMDDTPRMGVFARRFAPARCVPLEAGTRIDVSSDGAWPPGVRVLGEDGHVTAREAA
jgi:hypothetical protein